jgi:hypothetical protein
MWACVVLSCAVLTPGMAYGAPPQATDCGPAAGQAARVVNFSSATCAEVVDTINRFSADPQTQQIGPWSCHGIDAGDARKLGYTVECLSGTGRFVLAQA